MALTVIFALLGSAILSMTVMPVLASYALRRGTAKHEEPRLVRWLKARYEPVLEWALRRRRVVLGSALAVVVLAGAAATRLGSEFVPRLSEGTVVINTVRLADVSLSESLRYGSRLEKVLLAKFPDEVKRVWSRTGTAEVATDPMGLELTDVFITLRPRSEWRRAETQDELVAEMKAELEDMPGMRMSFLQPIEMRVNEMIAGVRSDLGIKVFGDDLDVLKATAREVESIVRGIPGAADVTVEQVTGQPVLQVAVDRTAAGRYGIPAREILDVVEAVGARVTGEVREGERRFDLAVRLRDEYRRILRSSRRCWSARLTASGSPSAASRRSARSPVPPRSSGNGGSGGSSSRPTCETAISAGSCRRSGRSSGRTSRSRMVTTSASEGSSRTSSAPSGGS